VTMPLELPEEVRKRVLLLFLGSWLIYLAFLPPGIYSVDGYSMLMVADSLVTHHDFTVPDGSGIVGRDGRSYSAWYPLQSVLALPVVAPAAKAASAFHLPTHYVESFAVTLLPALYTALTVALVFLIALLLGSDERGAWLASITYGFGSIALVYTRDFYADPLLALLMALGIVLAFRERVSWWIVVVTALAVLAKPTGIILGPVLSAYLLVKSVMSARTADGQNSYRSVLFSLLPGVGSVAGLGIYFFYNFVRFGNPRMFGQPFVFSLRFVPEGVVGLLISPGAGLLWFCPCFVLCIVALWQKKTKRLEAWTIAALAACSILLHSLWHAWQGGWSWGPRLLLPILPGLVALTGGLRGGWRKLLAVSALLGFLTTAPNLVSFCYPRYFSEATEHGVTEPELLWSPPQSLLLHAWPAALRQIDDARQVDVRQLLAERSNTPAATVATSRALRVVAVWWWVLPVVHLPRILGVMASVILAGVGIWFLIRARGWGEERRV
jgi:hypothetical protein